MTVGYKIIYFTPDPFLGGGIPIAALATDGERTMLVRKQADVSDSCLGGAEATWLVSSVMEDLESQPRIEGLPSSVGPHFSLGKNIQIPSGLANPLGWLEQHIFPLTRKEKPASTRRRNRKTTGYNFLRICGISGFVRQRFRVADFDWGLKSKSPITGLPPISHHAGSLREGNELLLLEPIDLSMPKLQDDLSKVINRFSVYRWKLLEDSRAKLVAYILPTKNREAENAAIESLSGDAHCIFLGGRRESRIQMIDRIRNAGVRAEQTAPHIG